jgi:hypothetical protein
VYAQVKPCLAWVQSPIETRVAIWHRSVHIKELISRNEGI